MATATDFTPGMSIAGCRIEAVAGRGGMGVIYRATELRLDRPVAVKLIAADRAAEPAFRERFERESRLTAAIDHPNVIPVYAAGEEAGRLYPDTANCRYPSPEDMISSGVKWPGNRRFLRPGSRGAFTVHQSATRLGSVTSSDTQQSWATSEQYSARFTLRTRNRCAVAPASVRRRVGYVCRARNGTVLAR